MTTIRAATVDDVSLIFELVRELAEFEREPDAVRLRGLRQLATVAFQEAGEHQGADVQLPLHLAFRITAIRGRYRAQRGGQNCREQKQKGHCDSSA